MQEHVSNSIKWRTRKTVVPFGWTQVKREKNGKMETLWRCSATQKDIEGRWRRCSYMCRKDRTQNKHAHRFTIHPDHDEGLSDELRLVGTESAGQFGQQLITLVAKWTGEASISVKSVCSPLTRTFLIDVMKLVLEFRAKNPHVNFNPDTLVPILNQSEIQRELLRAGREAEDTLQRDLQKFRFVNIMLDAATVLNMKIVHVTLSNPFSMMAPLPFRSTTKDKEWNSGDYKAEIETVLTQLKTGGRLCPVSICHDRLAAQSTAVTQVIRELCQSPDSSDQLLVDVPCMNHLLHNAFSASLKIRQYVPLLAHVREFTDLLRSQEAVARIRRKCPQPVATRWLYLADTVSFIIRNRQLIELFLSERFARMHPTFPQSRNMMNKDQKAMYDEATIVPSFYLDLFVIFSPAKFASQCFECEQSRLADAISIIEALQDSYKKIVFEELLMNNSSYELLHEFVAQLFARLEVFLPKETWAAWSLTREGRFQLRKKIKESSLLIQGSANDYSSPELAQNEAAKSMLLEIEHTFEIFLRNREKYKNDQEDLSDASEPASGMSSSESDEVGSDVSDVDDDDSDVSDVCDGVVIESSDEDETDEPWRSSRGDSQGLERDRAILEKRKTPLESILETTDIQWCAYEKARDVIQRYFTALYPLKPSMQACKMFDTWLYGSEFPKHEFDAVDDFSMWNNLGKYDRVRELVPVALRLISVGTSESDVERLISVHRFIVRDRMTAVSSKVLLARLQLHALKSKELMYKNDGRT